jgi:hypothetical protein
MYASIIVTDAGIEEVINAERNGTAPVVLTQVGFGRGQYTPTHDQTALHEEFKRLPANALAGGNVGDNVIYINARDTSNDEYTLFEFGVYTSSGTLFAVCSQNVPILQKAAGSQAYLDIEFLLTNVNPASVTLGDTNFFNPPATTETAGVVELATAAETEAGTAADKAVTPAGLLARTATNERTGLVQLATEEEARAGSSTTHAITPETLSATFQNIHDDYGFQKMPNGMIIQWGKATVTGVAEPGDILFPTAFPNKVTNISLTPIDSNASVRVQSSTNGHFKAAHDMNGAVQIFWLAIGY